VGGQVHEQEVRAGGRDLQAQALEARGHDVRLVMGNDPPGQFTRALHPRVGRHGDPPENVIPIGRSVIVPANGSLPNIVLSPRATFRIKRVLEVEGDAFGKYRSLGKELLDVRRDDLPGGRDEIAEREVKMAAAELENTCAAVTHAPNALGEDFDFLDVDPDDGKQLAAAATLAAAGFVTVGLLAKTALFPFHLWLPPAHAGAPPAARAVLSALGVKGSLFLLLGALLLLLG